MLRSNVSKNYGFTLVESLIVVSIIGILMAMAIPSLKSAIDRAKLAQATDLVVASLHQAQQEAIRRNRGCTLALDKVARKIVGQSGCLLSEDRYLPEEINLSYTGISGDIRYGARGNTTTNKSIILAIRDNTTQTSCLTISAPLGMIRLGTYDLTSNTCRKFIR